jgi:hypothetical protein
MIFVTFFFFFYLKSIVRIPFLLAFSCYPLLLLKVKYFHDPFHCGNFNEFRKSFNEKKKRIIKNFKKKKKKPQKTNKQLLSYTQLSLCRYRQNAASVLYRIMCLRYCLILIRAHFFSDAFFYPIAIVYMPIYFIVSDFIVFSHSITNFHICVFIRYGCFLKEIFYIIDW